MTPVITTDTGPDSQIVKVKIKKPKIKVPLPAEIQTGNGEHAARIQSDRPGIRWQTKDYLVAAGSIVFLIAALVLGYLRLVKSIDIFKPARTRIALASYVLFHAGDHVLVARDDLNHLISASEKSAEPVPQTVAIQTDDSATGDSSLQPSMAVAKADTTPLVQWTWAGTNTDHSALRPETAPAETDERKPVSAGQSSGADATDKGEEEDGPVEIAQQSQPLKSSPVIQPDPVVAEKQKSSEQTPSSPAEQKQVTVPAVVSPETDAGDNTLASRTKSVENGEAKAFCELGDCALAGMGVNKNINKALAYYKKAAALNYSPAYCRMAEAYRKGLYGSVNPTMALAMYKKAAEMNNIEAKCVLALQYYSRAKDAPQNSKEMIRWLNAVATNSFDEATHDEKIMLASIYILYGDCLMNGTYMRKNISAGAAWYEKAAKTGNPDGLYQYGLCLLNGMEAGQKNETEACKLFARAAEAKHAKAEWMLGVCYLNGTGVAQDKIKAVSWFKKAAEQNVPEAQYWMGECCLHGMGVAISEKDAFAWFLKSAVAGYKEAIVKVVTCYKSGIGTEKDFQKVTLWRSKLKGA